MPTIEDAIRGYIASNILFRDGGYPYSDNASFLGEGVVDSMNVLQLIAFIEEGFDLTVKDHEMTPDNFDSVAKLAAFVRAKLHADPSQDGCERTEESPEQVGTDHRVGPRFGLAHP